MSAVPKLLYWLPTLAWMFLIFSFSATPSLRASPVAWQDFIIRKTAHVSEYFILLFLFNYSLTKTTRLSRSHALAISLLFSLLYAATDELHQTLVYDRTGKLSDVIIDGLGLSLAGFLLSLRKPA